MTATGPEAAYGGKPAATTQPRVADKLEEFRVWRAEAPADQHERIDAMIAHLSEFPEGMYLLSLVQAMTWAKLDPVERAAIKWQRRKELSLGGFWEALWDAITRADEMHLTRLAEGFPQEVAAVRRWREDADFVARLRSFPFAFTL